MLKKQYSNSLSFLDVLFGALGAVLILFIIMLSMSGAPPRIRTPMNRTLHWNFILPDENPIDIEISSIDDENNIDHKGSIYSADQVKSDATEIIDQRVIGLISIKRESILDEKRNRISSLSVVVEVEDESIMELGMCLLIELKNAKNPGSSIPTLAKFYVSPSEETPKTIDKNGINGASRFLCNFELYEVDNGLMPRVNYFRGVNK